MAQTTAPYILIMEDDLIFADGWMTRTLNGLAELKVKQALSFSQAEPHPLNTGSIPEVSRW